MMFLVLATAAMALSPDCNQTSSARSRDDVQLVVAHAVRKAKTPDTRVFLDDAKLEHFPLSDADRKRIRKNTGICRCPGAMTSCGLGGSGQMLLSNVHLMVNKDKMPRTPLTQCTFQNQAIPPDPPVSLVFKQGQFFPATMDYLKEPQFDHAVVGLANRIPGANPFPVDPSGPRLRPGQYVLAVSGLQVNLPRKMRPDMTSPIVQECLVTETNNSSLHTGTFGTSCYASEYASGSFNFVRAQSGELQLVGIMQGNYQDLAPVGVPVNDAGTAVNNIMVDRTFLKDIMTMSAQSRMAGKPAEGGEL